MVYITLVGLGIAFIVNTVFFSKVIIKYILCSSLIISIIEETIIWEGKIGKQILCEEYPT